MKYKQDTNRRTRQQTYDNLIQMINNLNNKLTRRGEKLKKKITETAETAQVKKLETKEAMLKPMTSLAPPSRSQRQWRRHDTKDNGG